ncbi:MAG: hypothetical protein LBI30_00190, partial [Holosporales bacterium]|nr:hypothetical protein [Holosporales bacterium]
MRLSSRCIEEHETILSLLIKAAKSEEFPIIKKGQHISALTEARTRDLINYIHGKRRENPNFCIPFPDWMERYVKEGKTGFEEHKKRRHNEERTWDFMYGGSLMKEMKIKGSSE